MNFNNILNDHLINTSLVNAIKSIIFIFTANNISLLSQHSLLISASEINRECDLYSLNPSISGIQQKKSTVNKL